MILLRHGQSEFNVVFTATRRDPGIIDARLTALGEEQAERAAVAFAGEDIRRIVVSPYTRALQTAAPIARRLGVPVVVTPTVRERFAFACDIGSPRSSLAEAWPQHDFSALEEVWWPAAEESGAEVVARATRFRAEIAALPDWEGTLVVSHWGFILSFTGHSAANGEWVRCDPRAPPPERVEWHR
ncbi:MAG: histidine phosphatase family protein [Alphaproteobacteria bacterium]|nr:histidine phosphatase family protein [Alphaproteobacteria bacterium]